LVSGALALAKGLEVNDTLRTLKIANNPLRPEGTLALVSAILKNEKSAIDNLDLSVRFSQCIKLFIKCNLSNGFHTCG